MLLGVAASMFGSQGYAATSVSQLARKVGLSKPGFYHHVKGKKELLYEICHFSMTHLLMGAREALELSDDPVGQISDVIKRHGSFYREHSDKLASLRQARFLAPPQRREIYGVQRDYLDVVRTILRDGQRRRQIVASVREIQHFHHIPNPSPSVNNPPLGREGALPRPFCLGFHHIERCSTEARDDLFE